MAAEDKKNQKQQEKQQSSMQQNYNIKASDKILIQKFNREFDLLMDQMGLPKQQNVLLNFPNAKEPVEEPEQQQFSP